MTPTLVERAREALARAGEMAAEAEASFRGAIAGLNHAIDLAHLAGTRPQAVTGLVTDRASLGETGEEYLKLEVLEWDRTYRPGNWNSSFPLNDLHERPLQPASAPFSLDAAGEALTSAGFQVAQAEAVLDGARGRLEDALEFALHAGFGQGEVDGLVNPGDRLGPICSQSLKDAWLTDWDLDGCVYDGEGEEIPPQFGDLNLLALAEKGEGRYLAAAAIWERALAHLPDGHSLRPRIDQTITSLRAAARPGDTVTWDGRLIHSRASVHPPAGPAAAGLTFTGQPGARPPAARTGRPAATMTSPAKPARPRKPQ